MCPATLAVSIATLSATALGSFLALGQVGAMGARTMLLAPILWGREKPGSQTLGFAVFGGFLVGIALLTVLALGGVDQLPDWAKVPPTIVSVQSVYAMVMSAITVDSYEPSIDLAPGDLAFTLYGMITLPMTAVFVLVMTGASLLS